MKMQRKYFCAQEAFEVSGMDCKVIISNDCLALVLRGGAKSHFVQHFKV